MPNAANSTSGRFPLELSCPASRPLALKTAKGATKVHPGKGTMRAHRPYPHPYTAGEGNGADYVSASWKRLARVTNAGDSGGDLLQAITGSARTTETRLEKTRSPSTCRVIPSAPTYGCSGGATRFSRWLQEGTKPTPAEQRLRAPLLHEPNTPDNAWLYTTSIVWMF